MRSVLSILLTCICLVSFAQQEEKEQSLPEVQHSIATIRVKHLPELMPSLTRNEILELQTEDAGQLLQRFPGIHIRSYGGLGGLKTISVRGLGGQHSQLVIDGFSSPQDQTGQVNLGTVQTDNVEEIMLKSIQLNMAPASAMSAGNVIMIRTFENRFSRTKNELRFSQRLGSFGQSDTYLAYKKGDSLARYFVSVYGKYRQANGLYPYTFANGSHLVSGERINNCYQDLNAGLSFGLNFKNRGYLLANYRRTIIDQELPGPVLLYYDHADETLKQNDQVLQLRYEKGYSNGWNFLGFASARTTQMHYHDPSYFNLGMERQSDYTSQGLVLGTNVAYNGFKSLRLFLASEQQMSRLVSNETLGEPHRQHHYTVVGSSFYRSHFRAVAQLAYQYVFEHNEVDASSVRQGLNPFLEFSYNSSERIDSRIGASYRSSFRMPSFSELYYNNIGNSHLSPERAEQISLFGELLIERIRFDWTIRPTMYFNQVRDKIVAVPSQNLFIWSMQNVGIVHIKGFDIQLINVFRLNDLNKLNITANYTLQYATDKTNSTSPTYGHQLAYVPLHSGNADVSYHFKKHGFRLSAFANSLRFALNENVTANEVPAYALLDAAIFTRMDIKKNQIRVQLSCKNLLNSSYAVIRNYIMPGRSFLITLNYEIAN